MRSSSHNLLPRHAVPATNRRRRTGRALALAPHLFSITSGNTRSKRSRKQPLHPLLVPATSTERRKRSSRSGSLQRRRTASRPSFWLVAATSLSLSSTRKRTTPMMLGWGRWLRLTLTRGQLLRRGWSQSQGIRSHRQRPQHRRRQDSPVTPLQWCSSPRFPPNVVVRSRPALLLKGVAPHRRRSEVSRGQALALALALALAQRLAGLLPPQPVTAAFASAASERGSEWPRRWPRTIARTAGASGAR